tara:strand:- start:236185 stop:238065 length:1881 start_codon:yes stop_codon:yes gene_type:complete
MRDNTFPGITLSPIASVSGLLRSGTGLEEALMSLVFAVAVVFGIFPANANGPITLDPIVAKAEQQRIDAIQVAMPSAVSVFVPGGGGGGSGVLISPDGFALTNFHVSSPAGEYMRCGLSDGNIYDAVIVGIDPVGDLALIKLLGRDDFPYAEMADSRLAKAGDWNMVIGNPFLLASNLQPTVSWGILSGVGRYQYPSGTLLEYADCLQTDASINPGNSGGPLYDANGRLLGIVGRASFEKRGRINVGVGYAISIHQAKNFLGYLHSGRVVDHATLGATVSTDSDGGVRVSNILETSDAYRRGLTFGAEILEIDGRPVQTANDVQNVLATLPNGWRVKLVYRNDGVTTETLVRLMGVHRKDELLKKMAAALPPPPPRQQKKDEDDSEGDTPKKLPMKERPHGHGGAKEAPKYPKPARDLIQKREGYANYHFNLARQERFMTSLRSQFPSHDADQPVSWMIQGETDEPNPRSVTIGVNGDALGMIIGEDAIDVESKGDAYDLVDQRSLGGMLPALDAWRRMISQGTLKFGESYYLGTMPLGGQRPLRDCMVGIDGEMEVRWLSHPESGLVEVIEVSADRDDDPAELWVTRDADGQPTILDLRYGLDSVVRVKVKTWDIEKAVTVEEKP